MNSKSTTPARRKRNAPGPTAPARPSKSQRKRRNAAARDQDRFPREDENPIDYFVRLCRLRLAPPVLAEDLLNSERGGGPVDPLAQGLSYSDIVRSIAFIHHRAVRARGRASGQGG